MGAKFYFLDNYEYKADDINTVFAQLTTGGVSLYKQKESALIDYEEAVKNILYPGVDDYNHNSCKVVKSSDGKLVVSQGTCWLPNGSCIIIDESGLEVSGYIEGTEAYVYIAKNLSTNCIEAIATPTMIDDGILLAKISTAGKVEDNRTVAKSKIGVLSRNILKHITGSFVLDHTVLSDGGGGNGYEYEGSEMGAVTIDVGYAGFTMIATLYDKYSNWSLFYLKNIPTSLGFQYYGWLSVGINGSELTLATPKKIGDTIQVNCWLF